MKRLHRFVMPQVVSLQLSQRVTEKNDHFTEGIETVASIESDLQVKHIGKEGSCVSGLCVQASTCQYGQCKDQGAVGNGGS